MEFDVKKYEPIFGEWMIGKYIGKGSFGSVYKITREEFGITYTSALKVISIPQDESDIQNLKDDGLNDSDISDYYYRFVKEIEKEINVMSQLKDQSNIVSYEDYKVIPHDYGFGWDILIRMELLTPLTEYYREHDNMTEYEVMKMGMDICKALESCHKAGIIHRDIKPENIFVSAVGEYKLGDFGIAKMADKTIGMVSQKGNYGYVAPEVYKEHQYGMAADIYSLSLVLYRLLNNNRLPFLPDFPERISYEDREKAFQLRIKGEEMKNPVNASKKVAQAVKKGCEYQPGKRYGNVEKMRKALENAQIDADKKKPLLRKNMAGVEQENMYLQEEGKIRLKKTGARKKVICGGIVVAIIFFAGIFLWTMNIRKKSGEREIETEAIVEINSENLLETEQAETGEMTETEQPETEQSAIEQSQMQMQEVQNEQKPVQPDKTTERPNKESTPPAQEQNVQENQALQESQEPQAPQEPAQTNEAEELFNNSINEQEELFN